MFYDTRKGDHGLAMDPFKAMVAPRPIAWISTLSASGVANLAPHSFFNAFAQSPHYVAFGSTGRKDTLANIEATKEFVVSLVTFDLRDQMNVTSAAVRGDEFELAGLAKAPSHFVKPPRVAASPAALECKLFKIVELPDDAGTVENWLVIGRVLGIHLDDKFVRDGRLDTAALRLVSRLGYGDYATVDSVWQMRRPG